MNWRSRTLLYASVVLPLLSLTACRRLFANPDALHLQKAEELSRQGQYDAAIEEYQAHMRYRLRLKDRPEWENPYFYLILIGDLELGRGKPDAALRTYVEAEEAGVDTNLISDRYRSLARWYEEKGELERAVDILKTRREKDPILIDAMLDRISKAIVAREANREERGGISAEKRRNY